MNNYKTAAQNTNELYELLPPEIRAKLAAQEKTCAVPAGIRLISHDVYPECLAIVNSGLVEVSLPAGRQTFLLAAAGSGKVFGLRELVSGTLPEVDATTLEECQIAVLPAAPFLEILKQHPPMYLAIAKVFSADLRMLESLLRQRAPATPRRPSVSMVV